MKTLLLDLFDLFNSSLGAVCFAKAVEKEEMTRPQRNPPQSTMCDSCARFYDGDRCPICKSPSIRRSVVRRENFFPSAELLLESITKLTESVDILTNTILSRSDPVDPATPKKVVAPLADQVPTIVAETQAQSASRRRCGPKICINDVVVHHGVEHTIVEAPMDLRRAYKCRTSDGKIRQLIRREFTVKEIPGEPTVSSTKRARTVSTAPTDNQGPRAPQPALQVPELHLAANDPPSRVQVNWRPAIGDSVQYNDGNETSYFVVNYLSELGASSDGTKWVRFVHLAPVF